MSQSFVHLRIHTEFSLADGICRIKELISSAHDKNIPALAITDLSNLFASVKFYRAALNAGIKPIIGSDVWIENPDDHNKPYRLVLLCQSQTGYRNLNRLLSKAHIEGQHSGRPCINKDWLLEHCEGLIALSAALEGDLGVALTGNKQDLAQEILQDYQNIFPDRFYIELQRTGQPHQEDYNHVAVALAQKAGTPVVATNHVHFLKQEDFETHEARVCIHDGRTLTDTRRPKRYTDQQYLRSADEMIALFEDIPEAIENTIAIARRCNFSIEFGTYYLPDYPVPEGKTINDVLTEDSAAGMELRIASSEKAGELIEREEYKKRLALELKVIIDMGFPGYFLIVADFIRWAKNNDVPVGPGRGSGAGSLVAYVLGITDLDPIKYELLFERFLNPERVSMPDFDVDFCMEKRDLVIDYVAQRYGRDKVSQIITYGTMAAKAVVRDVGRILDHPYGFVDKIAKLVPFEIGITLEKALEQEPMLKERYDKEEDVRDLIDLARSLEGISRNAGKHAGGVVIAPTPLTDFMPIYCEQGGKQIVSQLDKDDLEAIGLVKFDFLGLRNLTIIDKAVKLINKDKKTSGDEPLNITHIPIDDELTFTLLKKCQTTALFQLESRGMKDLILRLKPDNFEEIIALVALFRPGPLQSGMVDDFIARKHGKKVVYPHPSIVHILEPTYGVILYQEQVMQIAQELSGYTLGGADLLRRAMGKKKPEEMAKQRDVFVKGAEEKGVNGKLASNIFDLIEKFAGYGFNRSHSAAYALIAYQTAYLKAHYPAAFMAAVLSTDMDNTDKVVTMIAECRDMGLEILPPAINQCAFEFVPISDSQILYGLGAIKGLGQAAMEIVLQARDEGGKFNNLFDLCKRIDLRKANRRVLESLIRAGAMDDLGAHRATLMASLNKALQTADQHAKNLATGQNDLFGVGDKEAVVDEYIEVQEWDEESRLEGEKNTLGLWLTGHPITRYENELAKIISAKLSEVRPTENKTMIVAGMIVAIRTMQTRRGDRMAFITLDDRTGRLELAVFSDTYNQHRELLVKDTLLVVKGQVSVDEYSGGFKMAAESVYGIDDARNEFARQLTLSLSPDKMANGFLGDLKKILEPMENGECPVVLCYQNGNAEATLVLGDEWRVRINSATLSQLSELVGENSVSVDY